jgi:hypothetical protein
VLAHFKNLGDCVSESKNPEPPHDDINGLTKANCKEAFSTNNNGWPKSAIYIPKSSLEQGNTNGLTIAQCDSPEQCKEVNGTPSPSIAAKKQCEDFSGERCVKIDSIPEN